MGQGHEEAVVEHLAGLAVVQLGVDPLHRPEQLQRLVHQVAAQIAQEPATAAFADRGRRIALDAGSKTNDLPQGASTPAVCARSGNPNPSGGSGTRSTARCVVRRPSPSPRPVAASQAKGLSLTTATPSSMACITTSGRPSSGVDTTTALNARWGGGGGGGGGGRPILRGAQRLGRADNHSPVAGAARQTGSPRRRT